MRWNVTGRIEISNFDRNDVQKALTLLMENLTEPDALHPEILRKIRRYIAISLTTIFNMSFDQGELTMD